MFTYLFTFRLRVINIAIPQKIRLYIQRLGARAAAVHITCTHVQGHILLNMSLAHSEKHHQSQASTLT